MEAEVAVARWASRDATATRTRRAQDPDEAMEGGEAAAEDAVALGELPAKQGDHTHRHPRPMPHVDALVHSSHLLKLW